MSLKVCVYCRVSTDTDDQLNSLQNQKEFFESYVSFRKDWTLVKIFADEGISGTSTKRRTAFNQMIEACKRGEIDLILTKEVSRFARNTVDALNFTRLLKQYNVGVVFINDNIDTRDNDGEFRLSIMASVAQEESRKTSSRVKWGQRRSMERGVVFGNDTTFGFVTKNGKLAINEDEARVVRLIFHKFLNEGKGTHAIARELCEESIPPPKNPSGKWSSVTILRILRNEKHCGDLLQKKYVTTDYLTHKKVLNRGAEEKIYIKDHHEPIVDREIWERAQRELHKRSQRGKEKSKYSNRYWCSGKIICGCCGSRFVTRKSRDYFAWACHNKVLYGRRKLNNRGAEIGCDMRMVNNKSLLACVRSVAERIMPDENLIAEEIMADIKSLKADSYISAEAERLKIKLNLVNYKKAKMLDSYFSDKISESEMVLLKDRFDKEIESIKKFMRELDEQRKALESQESSVSDIEEAVKGALYSEQVYGEIIEKIRVFDDSIIIQPKFCKVRFRLSYFTEGYKDNYKTIITGIYEEAAT